MRCADMHGCVLCVVMHWFAQVCMDMHETGRPFTYLCNIDATHYFLYARLQYSIIFYLIVLLCALRAMPCIADTLVIARLVCKETFVSPAHRHRNSINWFASMTYPLDYRTCKDSLLGSSFASRYPKEDPSTPVVIGSLCVRYVTWRLCV